MYACVYVCMISFVQSRSSYRRTNAITDAQIVYDRFICAKESHRSHSAKNHKKAKNIDFWQKIINLAKKTASWHKIAKNIHC